MNDHVHTDRIEELRQHVTERTSTSDDVDGILEIDQLSFENCFLRQMILDRIQEQGEYGERLERRSVTCSDSNDFEVLGYMFGVFHASRHEDEQKLGRTQFTISRLAVHPSTRWRYIGTSLIDHAIKMAKNANSTSVQVGINVDDVSVGSLIFLERMQFELSATAGILNLYERRLA